MITAETVYNTVLTQLKALNTMDLMVLAAPSPPKFENLSPKIKQVFENMAVQFSK